MKISIIRIVRDHFNTLRNASTGRISLTDVFIFLFVPVLIGVLSVFLNIKIGKDFYNISVTFFGIFIALLLNIQVAIFGVFQRNWNKPNDEILNNFQLDKIVQRRGLLRELNINVSYLIVISCLCLAAYIVLFSFEAENIYSRVVSAVLYTHFILTLLMVVKRTYALFQGEYDLG